MQRMAWTDERLEERFDGIDRRFDHVDHRFDGVDRRFHEAAEQTARRFDEAARQTGQRFDEVDRRIDGLDRRFDGLTVEVAEVRGAVMALHTTLSRGAFGVIVALVGIIVAIITTGG